MQLYFSDLVFFGYVGKELTVIGVSQVAVCVRNKNFQPDYSRSE